MKYKVIGNPRIQAEYCDEYETTMVIDLQREDGETGDVWIVAGVPDWQRGTCDASGSQDGLQDVRVVGDSVDIWCPESFRVADDDGHYETVMLYVIEACRKIAISAHRDRMDLLAAIEGAKEQWPEDEIRELVETGDDNDVIPEEDLIGMFRFIYGRDPEDGDERMMMWSHVCAGVSHG